MPKRINPNVNYKTIFVSEDPEHVARREQRERDRIHSATLSAYLDELVEEVAEQAARSLTK